MCIRDSIKTADQLNLPTPEVEYHNIVAQPTEHQQEMVKTLSLIHISPAAGVSTAGDLPLCLNAASLGGRQFWSLQAPYSR